MLRKDLIIQKLREIRDKIPEIKERGVTFHETAPFSEWRDTGAKWLRLGLPYTEAELYKFE